MVGRDQTRRALLVGLAALATAGHAGNETVADLTWRDLLPEGDRSLPADLRGILPHDESAVASSQPASTGTRADWNGRIVRLSGFVVPLDYSGTGVTVFILVPFVGACIHVPPPPANQLVLVTTARPFATDGLFEAVTVTGQFGTASTSTHLADIGYALSAGDIRPYQS